MGKRIILFCANLFWLCSCATTTGMTPEETSVSEEARYIVQIVGGREEFYKQGKIAVILDPQVRSPKYEIIENYVEIKRINGRKNSCFRQMDRPYPRKKFERKGC
ncbi:MAG: hypothetical protein ACLSFJ_12730 [Holdemania filiformis]